MSKLGIAILAAGKGTRMKSALPKVLHPVCGTPMALHVANAAEGLAPHRVAVVVGHEAARVRDAFAGRNVTFVDQRDLLGTADAVRRCEAALAGCDEILVLNGDSPLLTASALRALLDARAPAPVAFLAYGATDPGRMGRVRRDREGNVERIVEAADDDAAPGAAEVNAGKYAFEAGWLWRSLAQVPVSPNGEYYLTTLVALAHAEGRPAIAVAADPREVMDFDDRLGLAEAERVLRTRILESHMLDGVTITDPSTTYIDAAVRLEQDVTILPNCYLQGATTVATGAVIGPGTVLRNSEIGLRSIVRHSVIEESRVGVDVSIGPFAHVRGGAVIGDRCELGNYAEVKNSVIGPDVNMHHFSYMGDADVGQGANIAAGVITNNWDGVNKHRTVIGARAFIGCDTMLIAPIRIGEGALTASGSVVTRDVADGERVAGVPARPMAPKNRD